MDLADYLRGATFVFVGAFNGYREAIWNTSDGQRPQDLVTVRDFKRWPGATIFRPLDVRIDEVVRGSAKDLTGARVLGGTAGCDRFTFADPDLRAGGQYVFVMSPVGDADEVVRNNLALTAAFPASADGRVSVPGRPSMSLAAFRQLVATSGP